jgi:hypothetical protein
MHFLDISRQSFYAELHACVVASESPVIQQGHMDGGSMVSTTDQQCLLWYFQDLVDSSVQLHVADNTPHMLKVLVIFASLLALHWATLTSNGTGLPPCLPLFCSHMPSGHSSSAKATPFAMNFVALDALLRFIIVYASCRISCRPYPYIMVSSSWHPSVPLTMLNVLLHFLVLCFMLLCTLMLGRDSFLLWCKPGRPSMISPLKPGRAHHCHLGALRCLPQ